MLSVVTAPSLRALYQHWKTHRPQPTVAHSVLTPDTVIVPNALVGRWLSLTEAKETGVVANRQYPLPAAWVWEQLNQLLNTPNRSALSPFEGVTLMMRIASQCVQENWVKQFPRLNAYVSQCSLADTVTLASNMAQVFDRYQHYRTDWLDTWREGHTVDGLFSEDQAWQQSLWQQLLATDSTPSHQLLEQAMSRLEALAPIVTLPEHMTVFGVEHVSPQLCAAFEALSSVMDITIYTLQARSSTLSHWQVDALPFLTGNTGFTNNTGQTTHLPADERPPTALGQLQRVVFAEHDSSTPPVSASNDVSLCVVKAHSVMREVEAVHDFLCHVVATQGLSPSDIAIGVTDLDAYAPCFRAVFGHGDPLPFHICDALISQESLLLDGLRSLFTLPNWRFTREEVMTLLNNRLVLRQFGLEKTDVDHIDAWLDQVHVHWGVDAEHKQALKLPANTQHTWRQGLDRILLGFALPPADEEGLPPLYAEQAPMGDIEYADTQRFSRFVAFCDALIEWQALLQGTESVATWVERTRALSLSFFHMDEREAAAEQALLAHLDQLQQAAAVALQGVADEEPFELPLDAASFVVLLEQGLENATYGARFSGAINVANVSTLAGLPFKQVCLLGLGYDQWPIRDSAVGFDLYAQYPQAGDSQGAQASRQSTLQWLACVEQGLYLSYQGYRLDGDSERPPSVLLSEWLHLCQQHQIPVNEWRCGMHPFSSANFVSPANDLLNTNDHPMSPDYPLRSHNADWCRAAQQAGLGTEEADPMFPSARLAAPLPDDAPSVVSVDDMLRFFRNPQQAFLRQLGIFPESVNEDFCNAEPFQLDNFSDVRLQEMLLQDLMSNEQVSSEQVSPADDESEDADAEDTECEAVFQRAQALGILPEGLLGEQAFIDQWQQVQVLRSVLMTEDTAIDYQRVSVDLTLKIDESTHILTGVIGAYVHPEHGFLEVITGDIYDHHRVRVWLQHLLLNASTHTESEASTRIYSTSDPFHPTILAPLSPDLAREQLSHWLHAYLAGQALPLPFHPKLNGRYWDSQQEGKGKEDAVLNGTWAGSSNASGLCDKPEMQYLYRCGSPIDRGIKTGFESFHEWHKHLMSPLGRYWGKGAPS